MASHSPCTSLPLLLLLLHLLSSSSPTFTTTALNNHRRRPFNNTISAAFVFGDSTVDAGNNNYLQTISKCNFPPYGRDFDQNHTPTGRFTNGRLVTDFIVSYMGIKDYVPAYLNSSHTTEELMTGVSFASGGSGYDPLTSQINDGVISIQQQLEYFKEYKRRLEIVIGKEKTQMHISRGAFLISAGTNDLIVNYYLVPYRRKMYSTLQYQHFLLQLTEKFVQGERTNREIDHSIYDMIDGCRIQPQLWGLIEEGAKLIAVVGLPPLGCIPIAITLLSGNPLSGRQCLEQYSAVARQYNFLLQNKLKTMQTPSTTIVYADIYKPLDDMIKNPEKYGFEEVGHGCCGSGYLEFAILCNPKSFICPDASKYLFWDAVHPTQTTYYNIFQALIPILDEFLKHYFNGAS